MSIWKNLFGTKSETKPAPRPDPMEEERRRLDALKALDTAPQKEIYWRTLHPLVQACLLSRVGWEHETEVEIDVGDAFSVFHHWGYPTGTYCQKSVRIEELMHQLDSRKESLWKQYQEAQQWLDGMDKLQQDLKDRAWASYWEHFDTLPENVQHLVCWELAKWRLPAGRSGFHNALGISERPFPFSVCGWASYHNPEWNWDDEGVAFRIRKDCFGDRKPLLYYLDDDNWPGGYAEKYLPVVQQYSSGLSKVRVEQRRCKGWDGEERERQVVLFELDPATVKERVRLNGRDVPTKEAGEYIFVLPRAGEFYCLLGEVLNGEMIPLHKDDFCMK